MAGRDRNRPFDVHGDRSHRSWLEQKGNNLVAYRLRARPRRRPVTATRNRSGRRGQDRNLRGKIERGQARKSLNHGVVFSSRVHDQPHPSLRCHEHAIVRRLVMRPKHQAKATTLDQFRRHLIDHTGLDAIGHVAFAQPIFRAALDLLRC